MSVKSIMSEAKCVWFDRENKVNKTKKKEHYLLCFIMFQ